MTKQPNVLFIMSDDHALQAISAYRPDNQVLTPGIDRIAENGMIMDNCFCTNSLCSPSRAAILTGTYNHINGVRSLEQNLDGQLNNIGKVMQKHNYQTAIIGKWHLGIEPEAMPHGFDHYEIFHHQGEYYDPWFYTKEGKHQEEGYATELVSEKTLKWIRERDQDRPFFMMCHHKAPHRSWEPAPQYKDLYKHIDFRKPHNYDDDYANRGPNAESADMRIESLSDFDTKGPPPEGLTPQEVKDWKYQRYMEDYMATIKSVDDSVSDILDYLEEEGILDNTIVVYTSDQGFYTGEHGWFDKRFMYEESQHMPFLIQYPGHIEAGSKSEEQVLNIDFAATFLDYAGIDPAELEGQGRSFRPILDGEADAKGYEYVYYRYYDYPAIHNVYPHYGVRGRRYKLIRFENPEGLRDLGDVYWELYDLEDDPSEMRNRYGEPEMQAITETLKEKLAELRETYQDLD